MSKFCEYLSKNFSCSLIVSNDINATFAKFSFFIFFDDSNNSFNSISLRFFLSVIFDIGIAFSKQFVFKFKKFNSESGVLKYFLLFPSNLKILLRLFCLWS